jgi:hypothetical protein
MPGLDDAHSIQASSHTQPGRRAVKNALRDSGSIPAFAVGRNAIPSYNKMPSRSEWARPEITQLHLHSPVHD